jgi:hypothetical protein
LDGKSKLREGLSEMAREAGFSAFGIASADAAPTAG